ncbi:ankyrin [Candidatus Vecturithrix granuli]|uniref:Ankyrin n=1 Tax=Vecturithrix granuli TaxID=1499967 RepID=A0A081C028_VECG1|nr:ankyrin [Candidatus Vecturithrix granuli]
MRIARKNLMVSIFLIGVLFIGAAAAHGQNLEQRFLQLEQELLGMRLTISRLESRIVALEKMVKEGEPASVSKLESRIAALEKMVKVSDPASASDSEACKKLKELNINCNDAKKFLESVQKGDSAIVKLFLTAGMSPDTMDRDKQPALIHAAKNRDLSMVKLLLNNGAHPNAKNQNNTEALIIATDNGDLDIVKALLAKGADVNATTNTGATALMFAAFKGYDAIVDALLAKGADVNMREKEEDLTALGFARSAKNYEIIDKLRRHGAEY